MNFADTLRVNTFPAIHDSYHLLAHLLMNFDSLIADNMNPDQCSRYFFLSASIGLVKGVHALRGYFGPPMRPKNENRLSQVSSY